MKRKKGNFSATKADKKAPSVSSSALLLPSLNYGDTPITYAYQLKSAQNTLCTNTLHGDNSRT